MTGHATSTLAALLCLATLGCSGAGERLLSAYDQLAPPATPNPTVLAGVPFCTGSLSPAMRARVQRQANAIAQSVGPGVPAIQLDEGCDHIPWVRVAPEFHGLYPARRSYTLPPGIGLRSETVNDCVITHELLHALGLLRHAPPGEVGPMSDGDRGDCLPSAADVAILRRAYLGTVSR